MSRLAVAIPALNAAGTIGDVVRQARAHVAEVLVLDDGSIDGTSDAARRAGARVHRFERNRGKGAALREAFAILFAERFDEVLTMDADGQHPAGQIPLLAAARGDLVLGSRRRSFEGMSGLRRSSNALSSWAISRFAGRTVADVQTGFRKYSRRCIETTGFPEDRFEAESAVVVRAARAGLEVVEIPIDVVVADGRATSHYRVLVDSLRIARAVVGARFGSSP